MMRIEKTSTGCIIHQPTDEIKRKCLRYFSLSDPVREYFIYSGKDPNKKPLFGKEHDVIYITSGFLATNDKAIQSLKHHVHNIASKDGATVHVEMNRQPRSKLQEDCIKRITESKSSKITIEVKPGVGKTFMALYAISKLERKPLVVAPTVLLKNQWIENLTDLGIDKSDIATNIYDAPNKTFCVVTISSIENELRKDWKGLLDVIDKSNFGIKITDESHLHMKGLLKFDAICNIKRNWYLSATLGRSDAMEDRILNRALADAERFIGDFRYEEYQDEYINIYLQDIYYNASRKLCEQYFRYGKKGLIAATYYRMLMNYNNGKPFYANIIRMIKIADKTKEPKTKVLVLLPLLDSIRCAKEQMDQDPYFKNVSIATIDGGMSLSEKRNALESDLILSTTASMGTGVDVSNLGAVINFDQKSSLIIFEQIVGRLRNRGFQTYYFDVCDHVKYAKAFQKWGSKRRTYLPYMPGTSKDMKRLPDIRC